jgi:hypothetical protein
MNSPRASLGVVTSYRLHTNMIQKMLYTPTVFVIQEVSQDHIRNLKALSSILLVLCKRQNPI